MHLLNTLNIILLYPPLICKATFSPPLLTNVTKSGLGEDYGNTGLVTSSYSTVDLKIVYNANSTKAKTVGNGNSFTPSETSQQPSITFNANPTTFYAFIMYDADAPSRKNPSKSPLLHFLVINIPGNAIDSGQPVAVYIGPKPTAKTGPHRYEFFLYTQKGMIEYLKPTIMASDIDNRFNYNVKGFVSKNGLQGPVAFRYFRAKAGKSRRLGGGEMEALEEIEDEEKQRMEEGVQ